MPKKPWIIKLFPDLIPLTGKQWEGKLSLHLTQIIDSFNVWKIRAERKCQLHMTIVAKLEINELFLWYVFVNYLFRYNTRILQLITTADVTSWYSSTHIYCCFINPKSVEALWNLKFLSFFGQYEDRIPTECNNNALHYCSLLLCANSVRPQTANLPLQGCHGMSYSWSTHRVYIWSQKWRITINSKVEVLAARIRVKTCNQDCKIAPEKQRMRRKKILWANIGRNYKCIH